MGFLSVISNALTWDEMEKAQDQIKLYGVLQAIKLYDTFKHLDKKLEDLKWGEELEYHVGKLDHKDKKAKIVVEGYKKVIEILKDIEQDEFDYQAEFGSWMVEAVPAKPYTIYDAKGPIEAFKSLHRRRKIVNDEIFMTGMIMSSLSSWPNLGAGDFFHTEDDKLYDVTDYEEYNKASNSEYILDDMTNPHPRFPAMMSSVRERRGKKVDIRVPLYPDENTGEGKIDGHKTPGEIHMDSQHFGMGASCVQITFEAQNIEHAKYMHDCFIPLGPIVGALGASAPIYKGQLANWDFRWNIIASSVDSRKDEELSPDHHNYMPKSRYAGMNHYLSDHPYFCGDGINDGYKLKINQEWFDKLKDSGMTDRLAYHFASLFSHDSLVIFEDRLEFDPDSTEHFENLNSTNWNSVRFKPPPSYDSPIGWRVEFRPVDIQTTDFENGAYVALLNLLTKVINDFDVDFSLPISLSDINMERAHEIDAVTKQKFWWRTNIVKEGSDYTNNPAKDNNWAFFGEPDQNNFDPSNFAEMTMAEILEGSEEYSYKGLLPLIDEYMALNKFSEEDLKFYNVIFKFLAQRGRGEVKTGARYMRDFVLNHPDYQKDSVVNEKICYDLVKETTLLGARLKWDESFLGVEGEELEYE
eukprot:CAMPEP_0197001892 /NCGR_PEP_ID=MMETSP1380-20130617/6480_1 /TAXON_ID=5936 /ORGANISM="Euplotes crassus, Strain CT5" /LENGTH=637 /DNA_ID=CAMNT_0042419747 /DNA_START=37 /DNA_END=1950 /DNA_ORIENTATION=-